MSAAVRLIIRRIGVSDGFDNVTNYPDSLLDDWIADSLLDVPTSRLGSNADRAVAYYTCHLMLGSSSAVSSTGGGIKTQKAGDVSIEYHASSSSSSSAITDKYYEMYLKLIESKTRVGPLVLR